MTNAHFSKFYSAACCMAVPALVAALAPLLASCSPDSGGPSGPSPSASADTTSSVNTPSPAPNTSASTGNATTQPTAASSSTSSSPSTSADEPASTNAAQSTSTSTSTSRDTDSTRAEDSTAEPDATSSSSEVTGGDEASSEGGSPLNNAPVPSAGCQKANGLDTLKTGGMSVAGGLPTSMRLKLGDRDYIVDIPADYDPTHPYRLIFSWHQAFGSANGNAVGQYPANNGPNFNAQNYAFFGLHREAMAANEPAIFVAPQGIGDYPWNYDRDVALFDALLEHLDANLCIDDSRVFSTGFSFGAMMSHALSYGRQSKLRAVVTMAPANYNFTQPQSERAPFAYFGITGMNDGTCQWIRNNNSTTEGGKFCVLDHAKDNGCTPTNDFPIAMNGSKNHVCYDFEGCAEGYPVKVCTFDGNHTPSAVADGVSGGDDGLNAFVPPLAWEFISQF